MHFPSFLVSCYKAQWQKIAFTQNTGIPEEFWNILGLQFLGELIPHLLLVQNIKYRQKKKKKNPFKLKCLYSNQDLGCDNERYKAHLNISMLCRSLSEMLNWKVRKTIKFQVNLLEVLAFVWYFTHLSEETKFLTFRKTNLLKILKIK